MIALDKRRDGVLEDMNKVGDLALELGVELNDNGKDKAAAAVGIWLLDEFVDELPGGYDKGKLSPNSPVKELKSFPQDLVLVGRSSILIKGLSNRLNIPWSLAKEWAPIAREVLDVSYKNPVAQAEASSNQRVRFRAVVSTLKQWSKGRASSLVRKLPAPARTRIANIVLRMEERKSRQALKVRQEKQ
jgi:hypothetical protein